MLWSSSAQCDRHIGLELYPTLGDGDCLVKHLERTFQFWIALGL